MSFTLRSVLVSANATGTETISMASEAMSVDSGPESEFDFGDLESGVSARRKRQLAQGVSSERNILVHLAAEQQRVAPLPPINRAKPQAEESKSVKIENPGTESKFLNRVADENQESGSPAQDTEVQNQTLTVA